MLKLSKTSTEDNLAFKFTSISMISSFPKNEFKKLLGLLLAERCTPIFRLRLWTVKTNDKALSWDSLPDPDAPPPKSEPGLSSLYDEIRVTVGQEAQIITAVFPNPAIVMQVFLQRVFAQVVRPVLLLSLTSRNLPVQTTCDDPFILPLKLSWYQI